MIQLRPYQLEGEAVIRQAFRDKFVAPLYVLATGGGKTRIFSSIAHSAEKRGKRVNILCHRVELVDQIVEALEECGSRPDIIAAGYGRRKSAVTVCSVHTLIRRVAHEPAPDLAIIDEAHHATAATWDTILRAWPDTKRLGVTATPIRTDGRGLAGHFDKMIVGPSLKWLTDNGYLARARVFAPPVMDLSGLHTRMGEYVTGEIEAVANRPSITGDAIKEWRERGGERPAIAFAVSVKHAEDIAAQFRDAGVSAVSFSGKTDRALRRQIVKDFRAGTIRVLAQCDICNEGFDVPGAHVGLMLRPTQSLGLWRQQCGRILRPGEGKEFAFILDLAGNTQKFGRPEDEPEWVLAPDEEKGTKKKSAPGNRICEFCFAASAARALVCCECGAPFPINSREIEEIDGELVEVTAEMMAKRLARRTQGKAKTLEQLIEIGKKRGMRHPEGWARHVIAGRQARRARA